jgi:glycosyltransferase involved in cell wall biosynthesis
MKILHISQTDIITDSRILKEINSLTSYGFEVSGVGVKKIDESILQKNYKNNIYAINLSAKKLKYIPKIFIHLFCCFEMIFKMLPFGLKIKPQIVHCHDTLAVPIGLILKLIIGSKIIYDAHELESNRNGISKIQSQFIYYFEKFFIQFIDYMIVVSPSIKKWYSEKLKVQNIEIILNSPILNESKYNFEKDYLRNKYLIGNNNKIFIYVGLLENGRGIDLITEIFKKNIISSHIVFLGFGSLSNELKRLALQYKNIHYHDAVEHSQVVPIIQSADYGLCLIQNVSLSDFYSIPNKLLEYCFAKIPVLASNFPDISDLIFQHDLGFVTSLDELNLTNKILELQKNEYIFKFKNLDLLSWSYQENKLINLYNVIINKEK